MFRKSGLSCPVQSGRVRAGEIRQLRHDRYCMRKGAAYNLHPTNRTACDGLNRFAVASSSELEVRSVGCAHQGMI